MGGLQEWQENCVRPAAAPVQLPGSRSLLITGPYLLPCTAAAAPLSPLRLPPAPLPTTPTAAPCPLPPLPLQRTLEELFIKGPVVNTRDNPEFVQVCVAAAGERAWASGDCVCVNGWEVGGWGGGVGGSWNVWAGWQCRHIA